MSKTDPAQGVIAAKKQLGAATPKPNPSGAKIIAGAGRDVNKQDRVFSKQPPRGQITRRIGAEDDTTRPVQADGVAE